MKPDRYFKTSPIQLAQEYQVMCQFAYNFSITKDRSVELCMDIAEDSLENSATQDCKVYWKEISSI